MQPIALRNNNIWLEFDFEADLERASILKKNSHQTAIQIYKSVANQGYSEGQYQYGLALLGERNKKREFHTAVHYLTMAANQRHKGAQTVLDKIKSQYDKLSDIQLHFDQLNQPDDHIESTMPKRLQRAIVELILTSKKDCTLERPIITHDDIMSALDDLIDSFTDAEGETIQIVKAYKEQDAATLLVNGVAQYNEENQTCVELTTNAIDLPPEIWVRIEQLLSMHEQVQLAKTFTQGHDRYEDDHAWKHRLIREAQTMVNSDTPAKFLFFHSPGKRKGQHIFCDKRGKEELKLLQITDPDLIKKIQNGQRTVDEINEARSNVQSLLQDEDELIELIFESKWILARVDDGTLHCEPLTKLTATGVHTLRDKAVQSFLDQEPNQQHINTAMGFSDKAMATLQSDFGQSSLNDGSLTWNQLASLKSELAEHPWNPSNDPEIVAFCMQNGRDLLQEEADLLIDTHQ